MEAKFTEAHALQCLLVPRTSPACGLEQSEPPRDHGYRRPDADQRPAERAHAIARFSGDRDDRGKYEYGRNEDEPHTRARERGEDEKTKPQR